MSFRTAASQLLSARSVHLRIVPRPANLSESREIFRILLRFGDIDTFKSLRYEYHNPADNTAITIYRDANAAQKALDASPIRFALENVSTEGVEREGHMFDEAEDGDETGASYNNNPIEQTFSNPPPKDDIEDILSPPTLTNRSPPSSSPLPNISHPTPNTTPDSPPPRSTSPKHFQITVDRARTVHQDYIERQPFWKYYNPMKSMSQEDLAKKVPHEGLSDISKRPLHAHRTPLKVLKQMNEYLERGMPSLRGMASNSEMERAFREKRGE